MSVSNHGFSNILQTLILSEAVGSTPAENLDYIKDTISKLRKLKRKKHDEATMKEITDAISNLEGIVKKLK